MIILTGGIVKRFPGEMLPILFLLVPSIIEEAFKDSKALDKVATFEFIMGPPPGAHKRYPHENLKINPDMEQYFCPLPTPCFTVAMRIGDEYAYAAHEIIKSASATLRSHNILGGMYSVGNDKVYTGCVLMALKGTGMEYRFEFCQPSITLPQAVEEYNKVMGIEAR